MILIIDLSKTDPRLILKESGRNRDVHQWPGLYQLSETLILEIDKFLKRNKIKIEEIKDIKVIPGKQSMAGNRIAKATALGLKAKL